jgi:hypothetical protein
MWGRVVGQVLVDWGGLDMAEEIDVGVGLGTDAVVKAGSCAARNVPGAVGAILGMLGAGLRWA